MDHEVVRCGEHRTSPSPQPGVQDPDGSNQRLMWLTFCGRFRRSDRLLGFSLVPSNSRRRSGSACTTAYTSPWQNRNSAKSSPGMRASRLRRLRRRYVRSDSSQSLRGHRSYRSRNSRCPTASKRCSQLGPSPSVACRGPRSEPYTRRTETASNRKPPRLERFPWVPHGGRFRRALPLGSKNSQRLRTGRAYAESPS